MPNYNLDNEKAVLSSMMNYPDCADIGVVECSKEDFYDETNRRIFSAMLLHSRCKPLPLPIDLITLRDTLGDEFTGYLLELNSQFTIESNFKVYVKILKRNSILRQSESKISEYLFGIQEGNYDALVNAAKFAEEMVYKDTVEDEVIEELKDTAPIAYNKMGDKTTGIPSGFYGIDAATKGLQKKNLVIVAGRPGMGKSSFAGNVAVNVAKNGSSVAFFSLEMTNNEVTMRILKAEAQCTEYDIEKCEYVAAQKFMSALDRLQNCTIYEIDRVRNLNQILAISKKLKKTDKKLDLIIIDHIGLVQVPGNNKNISRQREIGIITGSLKELAKDLDCTVMALSQLNRDADRRENHEPTVADLRESGDIEQDADVILFPYREGAYHEDVNPEEAKVIIAKNRHGTSISVPLIWKGAWFKFLNPATEAQVNYAKSRNYEEEE